MKLGDKVIKTKGYKWPGVIVADFENTKGERRLVVESTSEGTEGALHIYNPGQLEVVREAMAGVYAVSWDIPERKRGKLTAGKLYLAENYSDSSFKAKTDDGCDHLFLWNRCSHLDGGNWTRVEIPA